MSVGSNEYLAALPTSAVAADCVPEPALVGEGNVWNAAGVERERRIPARTELTGYDVFERGDVFDRPLRAVE